MQFQQQGPSLADGRLSAGEQRWWGLPGPSKQQQGGGEPGGDTQQSDMYRLFGFEVQVGAAAHRVRASVFTHGHVFAVLWTLVLASGVLDGVVGVGQELKAAPVRSTPSATSMLAQVRLSDLYADYRGHRAFVACHALVEFSYKVGATWV